ncbi:dsRNA-binding PKR inhibitor-like protein [Seal parapoxvirus]|uniref:DsRNA-binding PKR inhibitor-like protein n=1 Tax=Seal parapoxvirus TaxID=187984 RepID=A0A1Z3GCX3_9POXV|nr:dsRNA-binding PKR inhibitor-like protein [Seal parapoxvirus]ASC55615.1 dsRNA-binding PKR inhibitor-like protein [Seal parapoxvirus]
MDDECVAKILSFLRDASHPVPAKRVASELGITKHCANKHLYGLLASGDVRCEGDCSPRWFVEPPAQECNAPSNDSASDDGKPKGAKGAESCSSDGEPMETECGVEPKEVSALFEDIDIVPRTTVLRFKAMNAVSAVNEYCMLVHRDLVFRECRTGGENHCPSFTCTVLVSNVAVAVACGRSKKAARHAACTAAITTLIDNCGITF